MWAALVLSAVVLATAMVGAPLARAELPHLTKDPFCRERVLRDYEAPLEALPEVREVPPSGRLPFAPRRISFWAMPDRVVLGGDSILYRFGLAGMDYGARALDWDVYSRLIRIDRSGRDLRLVKQKREHIGLSEAARYRTVGFDRSPQPGLYRFDVSFEDRDGKLLGQYSSYYRVVRRITDIRLRLNGTSFRHGDRILGKIENFSTEGISYGIDYSIQRHDGATWLPMSFVEIFGHPIGFYRILLGTERGTAGRCAVGLTVPESMSPGRYRMVKPIGGERRLVTAEFEVVL